MKVNKIALSAILIILCIFIWSGCENESIEYNPEFCDKIIKCDTIAVDSIVCDTILVPCLNNKCDSVSYYGIEQFSITYTKDIQPIIQVNCINRGCHCETCPPANFPSGVFFNSYDLFKDRASDEILLKKLKYQSFPGMPLEGEYPPLKECEIQMVEKWINSGFPE